MTYVRRPQWKSRDPRVQMGEGSWFKAATIFRGLHLSDLGRQGHRRLLGLDLHQSGLALVGEDDDEDVIGFERRHEDGGAVALLEHRLELLLADETRHGPRGCESAPTRLAIAWVSRPVTSPCEVTI